MLDLKNPYYGSGINKGFLYNVYAAIMKNGSSGATNPSTDDMQVANLFHYTSSNVLNEMLKTGVFRASHIFFQNDPQEYFAGIQYLKSLLPALDRKFCQGYNDAINKIRESLEKVESGKLFSSGGNYTISFSKLPDNLHQWITYAKESGVCIELDHDLLKDTLLFYEKDNDEWIDYLAGDLIIGSTVYIDVQGKRIKTLQDLIESFTLALYPDIEEIYESGRNAYTSKMLLPSCGLLKSEDSPSWENQTDVTLINALWENKCVEAEEFFSLFASYCKNSAFAAEEEYRAVFTTRLSTAPKYHYFPKGNGILRPYINIKFASKSDGNGCLPVKSITIGPSGNQQAVFDSVVHRVKYGEKKIHDYYIDDLKGHTSFNHCFFNYFWNALTRASEETSKKIRENDAKNVYCTLSNLLKSERSDWKIPEYTTAQAFYLGEKNLESKIKNSIANNDPEGQKISFITSEDLVAYINLNNYFTKEGIWIKKSKIPYVF